MLLNQPYYIAPVLCGLVLGTLSRRLFRPRWAGWGLGIAYDCPALEPADLEGCGSSHDRALPTDAENNTPSPAEGAALPEVKALFEKAIEEGRCERTTHRETT